MRAVRISHILGLSLVLVVVGAFVLWPRDTPPQDDTPPPASQQQTAPPNAPTPSSTSSPSPEPPPPADLLGQRQVVVDFAAAFSAKGPMKTWISGLEPYVTPELLEGLRYTDPRLRPRGPAVDVRTDRDSQQAFVITYPGQARVRCTLAHSAQTWQVSLIEPVRPGPQETA